MGHTRYTLRTLVKGLAALEALGAAGVGLTLTELARRLEESQTVIFRVLKTLQGHGYVLHPRDGSRAEPARHHGR